MVLGALVLAGLAGQRAYTWKTMHDEADARRAAVAAASAEARGLLSISATTSDEDVASLLEGATADFRSELESQAERLRTELSENDVVATGSIDSAAVSAFGGDSATVILAASGTVDNKQTAAPEPRNYRLKVTLVEEDGHWLVSGLEFVA